jgi:hypothetical protein
MCTAKRIRPYDLKDENNGNTAATEEFTLASARTLNVRNIPQIDRSVRQLAHTRKHPNKRIFQQLDCFLIFLRQLI